MASNNSNDDLHTNVRVKIEPGTSVSSAPSTSSVPLSERVTSIKMEPGLPITTQRLTSFRLPRDLTLGGNIKIEKPKKVYTPNVNVQRNKKKDDTAVKAEPVKLRNSDRGRERGRGDRGRGRGDRGGNVIEDAFHLVTQVGTNVLSFFDIQASNKDGMTLVSTYVTKWKAPIIYLVLLLITFKLFKSTSHKQSYIWVDYRPNITICKFESVCFLESLGVWSEGIYTAPTVRGKSDGSRVSSSTANTAKYLEKSKLNTKITDKSEEERRLKNLLRDDFIDDGPDEEKMHPLMLPRVKKDVYDMIDDDKINKIEKTDTKPIISENGEIINIEKEKESKQNKRGELTISEIVENKTNSYTLIQFPESLPGLVSSRDETGSKQASCSNTSESDNKTKTEHCTLNSLRSGLLGKLEILKSGKARLRLGEMCFFVDIGAQQRFQQDLLVVKIDAASQTGDLTNIGPVNNKLICSPDFESMLENS